jgi:hypothetical protein
MSQKKKQLAIVVAALSGVYLFIPEPTDLVPILGWLDEGMALALFGWSMRTLGVDPRRWFATQPAPKVITVKAD